MECVHLAVRTEIARGRRRARWDTACYLDISRVALLKTARRGRTACFAKKMNPLVTEEMRACTRCAVPEVEFLRVRLFGMIDIGARSHSALLFLLGALACEPGDGGYCGYVFAGIATMEDGRRADEVGAQASVELGPCRIDADVYCEFDMPPAGTYELVITAPGYESEYRAVAIESQDEGCPTTFYRERIIVSVDPEYVGPLIPDSLESAAREVDACVLAEVTPGSLTTADPHVGREPSFLDVHMAFGRESATLQVIDDHGFDVPDGVLVEGFTAAAYWSDARGAPYIDPRWDPPATAFVPQTGLPPSGQQGLFLLSGLTEPRQLIWQAQVTEATVSGAGTRAGLDASLADVLSACR